MTMQMKSHRHPNEDTPLAQLHVVYANSEKEEMPTTRRYSIANVVLALVAALVSIAIWFKIPCNKNTSCLQNRLTDNSDIVIPILGKTSGTSKDSPPIQIPEIPTPSNQDWCMAGGKYDILGTYRSPNNEAEGGVFFAPGRFRGVLISDQDDETAYFHLLNMTFGNPGSPQFLPNPQQEADIYDTYCTLHPVKPSACYVPKFFPDRGHRSPSKESGAHHHHNNNDNQEKTRCAKLSFPSMTGFALCRQLAMGTFEFQDTVTLGPGDVPTEHWRARLLTTADPSNEYNGTLDLFLRDRIDNTDEAPGRLKVPVTHWLVSDDETLEASFQVSGMTPYDASSMLPIDDVPEGCEDAVDITPPERRRLLSSGLLPRAKCPFAHVHHDVFRPMMKDHLKH